MAFNILRLINFITETLIMYQRTGLKNSLYLLQNTKMWTNFYISDR